jgi:hypothetical protein
MKNGLVLMAIFTFALVNSSGDALAARKEKSGFDPTYIKDFCKGKVCKDGTPLRTSEDESWTDTPCGPVAIHHAVYKLCASGKKRLSYFVNRNFWKDMGIGVRQMTRLLNTNFAQNPCPNGRWYWNDPAPGEEYINKIGRSSSGTRITLALVQTALDPHNLEGLHWYLVDRVEGIYGKAGCKVFVKDSDGMGYYTCEMFALLANRIPWFVPTPSNAYVWFKKNPPPSSTLAGGRSGGGFGGGARKMTHLTYHYLLHVLREWFDPSF